MRCSWTVFHFFVYFVFLFLRNFTKMKRAAVETQPTRGDAQKQVKTKEDEESVAIRSIDHFVASVAGLSGPELLVCIRKVPT
jgi:hypothetical protein